MCGVAAIYSYRDPRSLDLDELIRMRGHMACRGPDGEGLWRDSDSGIGLAHRRLAIIDLSEGGAQPMTAGTGDLAISYNGEIYNYQALRQELESAGVRFRSESDTEVLLEMYARKGPRMMDDLRGMFAFVLWDRKKGECFLARDPYGIKPLYYSNDGASIRVASQVKALMASGAVAREMDPAGEVGFLLWGHVPEPFTLFRSVRAVPAGSWVRIDGSGREEIRRYASVSRVYAEAEARDRQLLERPVEQLREAIIDSVKHHMVADVEVGLFLSAGLDSSSVAGIATELGGRLRTVTLGFEEFRGTPQDEVPLAERVAELYGTRHETVWLTRKDFQQSLESFLDAMDQPTLDGMNVYFVSRAAAGSGLKVAMSGLGGDELFGGYPSFNEVPRLVRGVGWIPGRKGVGRGFRKIVAPILRRQTSPKYAGLLEYGGSFSGAYLLRRGLFMPWELPELMDPDRMREGWEDLAPLVRLEETIAGIEEDRSKVAALESSWYMRNQLLRDADWAGMAHSLEVRVPFVDWTLLNEVAPLAIADPPVEKRHLPAALDPDLPEELRDRPKTGFVVPFREWMQEEDSVTSSRGLRGWARYVLDAYHERT